MGVILADSAFSCYQELKNDCKVVQDERRKQYKAQPLAKRVGYRACEAIRLVGAAVAVGSLAVGLFFSATFLLYGALGAVAFVAAIVARGFFETLSPSEEELLRNVKAMNFTRGNLPNAFVLMNARAGFIDEVAKFSFPQEPKGKVDVFFKFFKVEGYVEQYTKSRPVKCLHVYSLLLESIQHLAKKNLQLAKQNAAALEKADLQPFSDELKAKITLLTAKLKEPSKELQQKVQKGLAEQKCLKLADLDKVYELIK